MKYPKYLKDNDKIGITALSSGASDCVKEMDEAIKNIENYFKVLYTEDVYGDSVVSASSLERTKEFHELLDENVKLIMLSRGGDYLFDCLEYIDFDKIVDKNIWVEGASDGTGILYVLTTKYDLATVYGKNAKNFANIDEDNLNNIRLLKGNLFVQKSFGDRDIISTLGNFEDSGIIIGGCFDVIKNIIGTKFDNTKGFIEKYKNKKIIWYFDIFAMSSIDVYLSLLQLKYAGWFKYSDTFIFSAPMFPSIYGNIEYDDAIKKALGDKNIIMNANIGHLDPVNIIINGSFATITYDDGKMTIEQELV